jgi:hypothetical protein
MALERFGKRITVNGSNAFKEQIVIAATAANLSIVFDDPELEQRRLRLADPTTTQPKPIHGGGTSSPPVLESERRGPIITRNSHTPNPGTSRKPKSARSLRLGRPERSKPGPHVSGSADVA